MFDHQAVLAELPEAATGILRPVDHGSGGRLAATRLKVPLSKANVEKLRDAMVQESGEEVEKIAAELKGAPGPAPACPAAFPAADPTRR
jgi:hypothetical protein